MARFSTFDAFNGLVSEASRTDASIVGFSQGFVKLLPTLGIASLDFASTFNSMAGMVQTTSERPTVSERHSAKSSAVAIVDELPPLPIETEGPLALDPRSCAKFDTMVSCIVILSMLAWLHQGRTVVTAVTVVLSTVTQDQTLFNFLRAMKRVRRTCS